MSRPNDFIFSLFDAAKMNGGLYPPRDDMTTEECIEYMKNLIRTHGGRDENDDSDVRESVQH